MKPQIRWAGLILLTALIGSCNSPQLKNEAKQSQISATATEAVQRPTIENSPTPVSPTLPPASTISPQPSPAPGTATPIPATSASPVALATTFLTPTPEPARAAIQILAPGPASKVVSPIQISAYLKPGAKGGIRLDLLGEDGRLLGRKVMLYAPNLPAHVLTVMDFEIPGAAEAGRLVISTEDTYGRTAALASVDVVLMAMGDPDINPPGDQLEDILIQEPASSTFIQGGTVVVSGLARMHSEEPLLIELVAADGQHIGPSRLINVPISPDRGYAPFTAEVPYSLTTSTWVRLVVYESAGRIPGITHLSSIEILLGQ